MDGAVVDVTVPAKALHLVAEPSDTGLHAVADCSEFAPVQNLGGATGREVSEAAASFTPKFRVIDMGWGRVHMLGRQPAAHSVGSCRVDVFNCGGAVWVR